MIKQQQKQIGKTFTKNTFKSGFLDQFFTKMSSISDDRFFSVEDTYSKLLRRQTELEVIKSELSSLRSSTNKKLSTSKKVFVGSGPGSVLFLSDNPAKVASQVEKELHSIKKKMEKTKVEKSSDLNF